MRHKMPAVFSLKAVLWQVLLACVFGAALLGVRVRSVQRAAPHGRELRNIDGCSEPGGQGSYLCDANQLREIRAEVSKKKKQQQAESKSGSSSDMQSKKPSDTPDEDSAPSFLESSDVPPDQVQGHHTHRLWVQAHKHGDLPRLPMDRSPDSDTWDNSVSICACMLQENTTDVREWLLYHRCAYLPPAAE